VFALKVAVLDDDLRLSLLDRQTALGLRDPLGGCLRESLLPALAG